MYIYIHKKGSSLEHKLRTERKVVRRVRKNDEYGGCHHLSRDPDPPGSQ